MAGKRGHGEGYVSQLKSGNWRGQLMDGYSDTGKRKIVSFTGKTKKDVLRMMREYQTQRENNVHLDRTISLREWAERWYTSYQDQVQPSTYCNYRYTLNIIETHFGDWRLGDVLPMHIEAFIRKLGENYSDSQKAKCRSMLIQIYDAADANGLVARNPARKAKQPKKLVEFPADTAGKKDAFTDAEVNLLNSELDDSMLGNSIRLMLGTGLRVQELLALTAEDIAEDGTSVQVDKAIKTVDGKATLGPPKSARGIRKIPVPEEYRRAAIYVRTHGNQPFLWTSSWKNPLFGVKAFRVRYYRAIKSISGVRPLSPHCCRHTYITRLQAGGVPMETIARLAGHSKIQTTDQYLHTSEKTLEDAVAVLNRIQSAQSTQPEGGAVG